MGNFFKQPIFLLFVIVAIIAVVGWNAWNNSRTSNKNSGSATSSSSSANIPTNLTNADPADFNDFTQDEFSLAVTKAKEVDPNYKVSALEVEIGPNLTPESVVTRYFFSSEDDSLNNWAITISSVSKNYIRALIPKSDYIGNVTPIDVSRWKFNYVTALQIAEESGGSAFRSIQGDAFSKISLTLKQGGENNWLVWTAEYFGADTSTQIKIDAYSGNVI